MAQQATQPNASGSGEEHGHSSDYVKVWAILLALLVASVLGPMAGIPWLTLVTAFGIAVVKAYLVAKRFMHLNVEPRFVVYLLVTCVALMFLMFAGVAPDVMRHDGHRWQNVAAKAEVKRVLEATGEVAAAAAPPALAPDTAFATICSSCHGSEGNGAGPAAAALNPKPANFQSPEFWATRDVAHIAKVIRNGGAAVGRSALMPGFGGQFDEAAAEALAKYVAERFRPQAAAQPIAAEADASAPAEPSPDAKPQAAPAPAPAAAPRRSPAAAAAPAP